MNERVRARGFLFSYGLRTRTVREVCVNETDVSPCRNSKCRGTLIVSAVLQAATKATGEGVHVGSYFLYVLEQSRRRGTAARHSGRQRRSQRRSHVSEQVRAALALRETWYKHTQLQRHVRDSQALSPQPDVVSGLHSTARF